MDSSRNSRWTRGPVLIGLVFVATCGALAGWYYWSSLGAAINLEGLRQASAAGNWARVRTSGHGYLRRHPNDAEAMVLVARAEAAEQRFELSLKLLTKVPNGSPWSAEARLREGQAYRQLFRGKAAERAFRKSIELGLAAYEPQRSIDSARLGLVQLFAIETRTDEARELLWELYRTSPQPVAVLELLGRLDIEGSDPHLAIGELEKFVANDPEDLQARRALVQHYLAVGRAHEARPHAERCVASRTDHLKAWENLLGCLTDLGDTKGLDETLARLPNAAGESAWFCKFQGIASEQAGHWQAAEKAYRLALKIDPFDSRLHFRLGRVLHQLGSDPPQSEQYMARSQELTAARSRLREFYRQLLLANQHGGGPTSDLCYNMGSHYESLGLRDGAAAWYREVLKREPGNSKSRAGLARLEQIDGR